MLNELRKKEPKFNQLCEDIIQMKRIVVAFSGGVDSTFLVKVASELLGKNTLAITVNSPYIADWEIDEAIELTKSYGVAHDFLRVNIPEVIKFNPENRCYLCKTAIFSAIKKEAEDKGFLYVCDGSNSDDTKDYRPGMIALKELNIQSPLLKSGISKSEIRKWSKALGLETWNKPAYACLLTRLPYNIEIRTEDLKMIERAELTLMKMDIRAVRVRKEGDLARIEIANDEMHKILDLNVMATIAEQLKEIGFEKVTLDLGGYQMGSFNASIKEGNR